jgi:hypothetical protein
MNLWQANSTPVFKPTPQRFADCAFGFYNSLEEAAA